MSISSLKKKSNAVHFYLKFVFYYLNVQYTRDISIVSTVKLASESLKVKCVSSAPLVVSNEKDMGLRSPYFGTANKNMF